MSRIKVMSKLLASRIAAGEVIERPASVVKELVENSIDAGATEITVEIERAGSRLIAVTDNGCGMDEEDALLSLQQHGTSKLLNEKDLDRIMTLGFRGEAIPSIASVSKFTMITRTADAPGGTKVECDGEGNHTMRPCAAKVGTRIEVRDLFANLPARRKFLKSAATEEHHIEEVFSMIATAHIETSFKLIIDNRVSIQTPASGKIEYRLREIFGKNFVDNLLPVEYTENGLHISGFIAAPGFTRPSRRDQRVFINSRPVEAQAVYRGIKDGYATLAESGRYNPVVLFMDMPPEELDINVHPAKREVRFKAEYFISRAVASAVSSALRQLRTPEKIREETVNEELLTLNGKLPLSMILDAAEVSYHPEKFVQQELPVNIKYSVADTVLPLPPVPEKRENTDQELPAKRAEDTPEKVPENTPEKTPEQSAVSPMVRPVAPAAFSGVWPFRIIGAVDRTYILAESGSGLVLIDQHAAHERIMFEKILDRYNTKEVEKQQLLLPETIELPRSMIKLISGNKTLFEKLGFDLESAGGTTVMVNSIPVTPATHRSVADWINDMLEELLTSTPVSAAITPEAAAKAACKAAIKAHDELTQEGMYALLEQLKLCRQGTLCPHGRPTLIDINMKEIERRFGRR
ncbi:MAG: DNA mismatch repair endonuclease MutL [Lentisphaerae bacterium]|nr:DNA mismatch repair endonuclease MutL [Lentisphaerota bacterium]